MKWKSAEWKFSKLYVSSTLMQGLDIHKYLKSQVFKSNMTAVHFNSENWIVFAPVGE